MKTTARSRVLIAAAIGLAFSAVLFQDLAIIMAFLVVVAVLLGEYFWLSFVVRNPVRFVNLSSGASPEKKALHPGEESSSTYILTRRTRDEIRLSSDLDYVTIKPNVLKSNEASKEIHINFRTPFSGEYLARGLTLSILGPLKLFEADCSLPLATKYLVFPKVVQVALTSARILGRSGIGETPINAPGPGTEFYELREYQTGDDFRHINWKASARRNEFIVNDRMREVGGSYYLVLDSRVSEYSERDRLASAFLHVANTLAILRTRFGVILHDGEKITAQKRIDVPETSLGFSISTALEFAKLKKAELPEELIPVASYILRNTEKVLIAGGYELLSEIEGSGSRSLKRSVNAGVPLRELASITMENENEPPAILYFSAMHGSIDPLLEAASGIKRNYRGEFTLVAPTMPWVTSSSVEEGYDAYTEFYAKIRAFENSGIDCVVGEPIAISRNLFEHR